MQSAERPDFASKVIVCRTLLTGCAYTQKQTAEKQASLDSSRARELAALDDIGSRRRVRTPADVDHLVAQPCIYGEEAALGVRLEKAYRMLKLTFPVRLGCKKSASGSEATQYWKEHKVWVDGRCLGPGTKAHALAMFLTEPRWPPAQIAPVDYGADCAADAEAPAEHSERAASGEGASAPVPPAGVVSHGGRGKGRGGHGRGRGRGGRGGRGGGAARRSDSPEGAGHAVQLPVLSVTGTRSSKRVRANAGKFATTAGCRAPWQAMLMGYLKLTLTTTCLVHSLSSEGAEAGGSTAGLARSVAASAPRCFLWVPGIL